MGNKIDTHFEDTIVRLSRYKRAWTLEVIREAIRKIATTGHIDERSKKILDEADKEVKRGYSH